MPNELQRRAHVKGWVNWEGKPQGGIVVSHQVQEILIYHHSHLDVGYTQHPSVIWARQTDYLRHAMDLAERYREGNAGEQFKWVAESSAVVEYFLRQATTKDIDRFLRLNHEGLIETTAMYCNVTPLFTASELLASLKVMTRLRTEFDIPVTSAVNHDVNGESWMLPDFLTALGVNFLLMGINQDSARPPEPRPRAFWWEGYGGKRILTWNGEHYGYAQYVGIPRPKAWIKGGRDLEQSQKILDAYLDKIVEQGYALSSLVLSVTNTVTWDNDGPNEELVDFVRAWNQAKRTPRLRLVNPRDIPGWLEREDANHIPVRRGDWTDWWSDGVASSARETALKGWATRVWEASRWLRAMSPSMNPSDREEFDRLQPEVSRHLMLYNEHTWGSAESISSPDAIHSLGQWNSKSAHAYEAAAGASRLWSLSTRELARRVKATRPSVLLFNPLPWPEKFRVILPRVRNTEDFGGAWPLQELARDLEMANPVSPLYVAGTAVDYGLVEMPALGYHVMALRPPRAASQVEGDRWTLRNDGLELTLDPLSGSIQSLVSLHDGYQWCERESGYGIGEFVMHRVSSPKGRAFLQPGSPPRDTRADLDHEILRVTRVKDLKTIHGPGSTALRVELEAEGCRQLTVTYTLYDAASWIDMSVELDREFSREIESVYLTFPMNVSDAHFHYASGGAVIEGELEQLPNACRDYYSVDAWADVSNEERGITLATPDVPLVLWGGFTVGAYAEHHQDASPLLVSWVMNNHWHTNFKADQAGKMVMRYRLLLHHSGFDAEMSQRMGVAAATPLLAFPVLRGEAGMVAEPEPADLPAESSFLKFTPQAVQIIDLAEETSDAGTLMTITWLPWVDVADGHGQLALLPPGKILQAWQTHLDGESMTTMEVTKGAIAWNGTVGTPVTFKLLVTSQAPAE